MNQDSECNYTPLSQPIPISEQVWPESTFPGVSRGTLTYNHESFIRDCIEGILMHMTTVPVRVFMFEDFSIDKTADIIRGY